MPGEDLATKTSGLETTMKTLLISTAMAAILTAPTYAQSLSGDLSDATQDAAEQVSEAVTSAVDSVTEQSRTNSMISFAGLEISAESFVGQRVYVAESGTEISAGLAASMTDAPDTWEDIGEIGDVMIDGAGNVNAMVMDIGGLFGIGERHVRVSPSDVQIINDADDTDRYFVVYTGSRVMLEAAAEYDIETASQDGVISLRNDGAAWVQTSADVEPMGLPDDESTLIFDVSSVTAAELQDARVYGRIDGRVGEVSGLVLNDEGDVTEILVDVGGWLGMGEHTVALGFDQIELRRDGQNGTVFAYVGFTQAELEAMTEWEGS